MLVEDVDGWPEDAWLVLDDTQILLEREPTSEFVSSLLRDSRVNALMCTRQRPAWITARDLLYGHALEIGRNSLAMTHEEAAAVMPDIAATPGVVALADGWPAVVGLASLMPEPTLMSGMTAGLPEALYDYLAEELYQSLPPPIQDSMCLIAVAGVRSRQLIEQLLPARDREKTLRDVVDAGWLTTDADGKLELHPLLEAFLRQKLDEAPTTATRAKEQAHRPRRSRPSGSGTRRSASSSGTRSTRSSCRSYERRWTTFSRAAAPRRCRSGSRTRSERSIAGPELDLSSAELLFREGRFHEVGGACVGGSRRCLRPDDNWASASYARAGRAAHAANREHEAFAHYQRARRNR